MIRGVIFDYGGTLDTAARHWSELLWEGYLRSGVPVTKEQFITAYIYAERELARVQHIHPEDTFYDLLYKKVAIELQNLVEQEALQPGIEMLNYTKEIAQYCDTAARNQIEKNTPVLQEVSRRYPIALVTNFYGNITTVLKEYGIAHYFTAIVESAVVGERKPSPRIFTLGVEALSLHPYEVVVIGDSYTKDIAPSIEAGCKAVWLKGESWQGKEEKIEYDQTISTLKEFITLLDKF